MTLFNCIYRGLKFFLICGLLLGCAHIHSKEKTSVMFSNIEEEQILWDAWLSKSNVPNSNFFEPFLLSLTDIQKKSLSGQLSGILDYSNPFMIVITASHSNGIFVLHKVSVNEAGNRSHLVEWKLEYGELLRSESFIEIDVLSAIENLPVVDNRNVFVWAPKSAIFDSTSTYVIFFDGNKCMRYAFYDIDFSISDQESINYPILLSHRIKNIVSDGG